MRMKIAIAAAGGLLAALAFTATGMAQSADAPAKPKSAKAAPKKPAPNCATLKTDTDCGTRADCRWANSYVSTKTKKEVPARCKVKPRATSKKAA